MSDKQAYWLFSIGIPLIALVAIAGMMRAAVRRQGSAKFPAKSFTLLFFLAVMLVGQAGVDQLRVRVPLLGVRSGVAHILIPPRHREAVLQILAQQLPPQAQ